MSDNVRDDKPVKESSSTDSQADIEAGDLWNDMKGFFSGSKHENKEGPVSGDSQTEAQKVNSDLAEIIATGAAVAADLASSPGDSNMTKREIFPQ